MPYIIVFPLIITYCTLAFGIHGGEGITGINRQVRNLLCAVPFGLVLLLALGPAAGGVSFVLGYVGANVGFKDLPNGKPNYCWLPVKGLITFPAGGFLALPLAYRIGYATRWTNVLAEYLSGTLYGILLCATLLVHGG